MANPPKPLEQKRLTGNPGKRALPKEGDIVVIPQVENPQPLRPLGDVGLAFWD